VSLLDFLNQSAQLRAQETQDMANAARAATPTPAQAAYFGASMAPGFGATDAAGQAGRMPRQGETFRQGLLADGTSMAENLEQGNILDFGLQGLGLLGDAAYAIPAVGPFAAGAIKIPRSIQQLLKANESLSDGVARLREDFSAGKSGAREDYLAARNARDDLLRDATIDEQAGLLGEVDTSYRGSHQPRGPESENPVRLDDVTKDIRGQSAGYPNDFYSEDGRRIYAPGARRRDDSFGSANSQSYRAILAARNKPNATVKIYRAVPNEDSVASINPGDFVTLSPEYAKLHALEGYGPSGDDAGKVISKTVKVRDVYFAGDDVNEFGYFPQTPDKNGGLLDD